MEYPPEYEDQPCDTCGLWHMDASYVPPPSVAAAVESRLAREEVSQDA